MLNSNSNNTKLKITVCSALLAANMISTVNSLSAFDIKKDPFSIEETFKPILSNEVKSDIVKAKDNLIKDSKEICTDEVTHEVFRPPSINDSNISSVSAYSPTLSGHDWYAIDHIGYKDTAFGGERHVAYFPEESGVHFFGYDSNPYTDLMILKHDKKPNQTVSLLQAPTRADWHTLDGNGVLFGIEAKGLPTEPRDINSNGKSSGVTITGYSAVATMSEIQIREYNNVKAEDMGNEGTFTVLYKEPKECPSVDFNIDIVDNKAKVYLEGRLLKEINLKTSERNTGIIVSYAAHGCPSLSSVYTYSHMVDQVEYLKKKEDTKNNNK